MQREWDTGKWQGRPHSLLCFDELTEFTRTIYRFLLGWNRSTLLDERCRVVCTGNPPVTVEGRWVIEEWAPWLDDKYPNPAQPGELRWYTYLDEKLTWLDNGEPIYHKGEKIKPKSRTFIPAALKDNPALAKTDYLSRLQALPEPLRSALKDGNFKLAMEDAPFQVIPTKWVELAMDRWRANPNPPVGQGLTALGADIARGGTNKMVIAPQYGNWIGELKKIPGREVPDGPTAATHIHKYHDGKADVYFDSIAVGSSVEDCLKDHMGKCLHPINNAVATNVFDKSGKNRLFNMRAVCYWKCRE